MYGSETRAQNLNVQYGKIFGIFGFNSHSSVAELRFKVPFSQVSSKIGCNEPNTTNLMIDQFENLKFQKKKKKKTVNS